MNAQNIIIVTFVILISLVLYFLLGHRSPIKLENLNINPSKRMQITSPSFENNADIPSKFTCDGENISPALKIAGVPAEAKSLALIIHDPDAPVAGGFTHWVIFNISPRVIMIPENGAPENYIQGTNGSGHTGYTGPCPPSGTHHYQFRLYALDGMLSLNSSAKKADVEKAMATHILDQAELVGLYKKM